MNENDDRIAEQAAGNVGVHPGARLAEAREGLKLSAADVARQLKLSVAQVEALESGQFDRLPGSVFVRGFIRNYARLVKLDPDELLRAAASSLPQQAPRPEVPLSQDIPFPTNRSRRWRKYAWFAAVVVAALATYEFFVSSEETVVTTHQVEVTPAPQPPAKPEAEKRPAPMDAPVTAMAGATDKAPGPPQPSAKVATTMVPGVAPPKVAPDPQPVKPSPPVATVPAPEVKPAAASAPADPAQRQVTLVFEDESWVEIRDRYGKLILFQLNAPGTRQVVSGLPPLSFVIGNAHGVRLSYDDRPVDLERHTKTDVARLTLE